MRVAGKQIPRRFQMPSPMTSMKALVSKIAATLAMASTSACWRVLLAGIVEVVLTCCLSVVVDLRFIVS